MLPIVVVIGSFTPAQRVSVFEKRQHESVAFGELAAQYAHRLPKLSENPQLSGSFCAPVMQSVERESDGSAHVVKSARISCNASAEVLPHIAGVDAIDSSL